MLESVDTTTDVVPTIKDPVEFTTFTTPWTAWRAATEEVVVLVLVVVSAETGIATPTTSTAITANMTLISRSFKRTIRKSADTFTIMQCPTEVNLLIADAGYVHRNNNRR